MKQPAQFDDEDARKLAIAADDDGSRYLERADGSWAFVDDEGWEVDASAEIVSDRNGVGGMTGRQIFVAPQPLCDSADVECCSGRKCRCGWSADAARSRLPPGTT